MSGKTKKVPQSKFAGFVTPPIVEKREALDLRIKVDPKDLARVDDLATTLLSACDSVEASAKRIVDALVSPQKLQNQRVQITVLDATGAQVAAAVHDLKPDETLSARISDGFIGVSSHRNGTDPQ